MKEEFLRIQYNVKYEKTKSELKKLIYKCRKSNIPEMIEVSKIIENWLNEVVNHLKMKDIQMDLLRQIIMQ